jgi:hypothetical protein
MIARLTQPINFRGIFDRVALLAFQFVSVRSRWASLGSCRRLFEHLRVSLRLSDAVECGRVLLREQSDQFRLFCPDCREETVHQGFDELGFGWYAQIARCRECGRQHMRVWALG